MQLYVGGGAGGDRDLDGVGFETFAEVGVGPEIVVDLVPGVEAVEAGAKVCEGKFAVVASDEEK